MGRIGFQGGLITEDAGVLIIGLHNPTSESLNIFDLYWAKKAYEAYLGA